MSKCSLTVVLTSSGSGSIYRKSPQAYPYTGPGPRFSGPSQSTSSGSIDGNPVVVYPYVGLGPPRIEAQPYSGGRSQPLSSSRRPENRPNPVQGDRLKKTTKRQPNSQSNRQSNPQLNPQLNPLPPKESLDDAIARYGFNVSPVTDADVSYIDDGLNNVH
ncbi:hypothetical protein Hypma_000286 [Hypsizygus marmoreus]|uniref:Uncharacterized protein n=1 Tax=Hypsizygus marmoreus TaxID=39966 RepID=A0A369JD68_HYPMA|nr:hypothetical protein Hypma_000286 [Hypsizygus marmoreus]